MKTRNVMHKSIMFTFQWRFRVCHSVTFENTVRFQSPLSVLLLLSWALSQPCHSSKTNQIVRNSYTAIGYHSTSLKWTGRPITPQGVSTSWVCCI